MRSFDQWMSRHQTEWRERHMVSKEYGKWQSCQYSWILPEDSWEEGLWLGIGKESKYPFPLWLRWVTDS